MFQKMGRASSQSLLCYRISAQHNVFLQGNTVTGCNDAGCEYLASGTRSLKNVLQGFYRG